MYFESKFIAQNCQKEFVEEFLENHLSSSDPYPLDQVQNLYFDNLSLQSTSVAFSDAAYKKKFRLRLYESTQQYSLQMKIKINGQTEKRKLDLTAPAQQNLFSYPNWESLLSLARPQDGMKMTFNYDSHLWGELRPLVMINYTRRRYRIGDFRITWDTDLVYTGTQFFPFLFKKSEPAIGILEIKSSHGGLVPFIDQGLGLKLEKTNISKFKSALTSLKLLHLPIYEDSRNEYEFKSVI